MSSIQWLSPEEQSEWDAFVTRHPLGLVYHLSSWQRTLETAFRHIRGRFLIIRDESGRIQAGLPVYTVTSWLLGNRTVSVPFATMCDPLISTKEEYDLLWPAITDVFEKHRSHRIEIRTRHSGTGCLPALLAAGNRYKHHYLPLDKPVDALFRNFHQTTIRQRVKKASRAGVVVEERQDELSLRSFHSFIAATRRRKSLPPIPFAFFKSMYHSLRPDNIALYLALHAGKPVGGLLASKFKGLWTAEYSGVGDNSMQGISPLLYWDTIQRAKNNGATCYSFGRTSIDNKGLIDFKRRWGTVEEDLTDFVSHRGSASVQSNGSNRRNSLAFYNTVLQLCMRYTPARVQRWIGNFCYRHMG